MATKKRANKPKSVLSVELPGGETLEFRRPGIPEWDRYYSHSGDDRAGPGRRELAATCCISHKPDDVVELLKKRPAVPKMVADALEDCAGARELAAVDFEDNTASVISPSGELVTVRAPSLDEWEAFTEASDVHANDRGKMVREFVVKLLKEPAQGEFEAYPALPTVLLNGAAQLAGAGLEVKLKKG